MKNTKRGWILLLVLVLTTSVVSAISKQNQEIVNQLKRLNKPFVKSIKSSDGDIIDCVKLADQPAFDHPLLKNHKIQLSPTFNPEWTLSNMSKRTNGEGPGPITQLWQLSGSCPKGTIPIRRRKKSDIWRERSFVKEFTKQNQLETGNEQAVGYINGGIYFGTEASLNIWNPSVTHNNEFSKSQIWVQGLFDVAIDSIETGWHVSPQLNGDNQTRFFIFWTNDGHKTGCYNHICPGFVQVSQTIALGSAITPISTYGGNDVEVKLSIIQDPQTRNWWLKGGHLDIGYWPNSLFSYLQNGANLVKWGGVIQNYNYEYKHTTTQMGSGHFGEEADTRASYIGNILILDSPNGKLSDPSFVNKMETKSECYNVVRYEHHHTWGTFFYFGGPGRNQNCH